MLIKRHLVDAERRHGLGIPRAFQLKICPMGTASLHDGVTITKDYVRLVSSSPHSITCQSFPGIYAKTVAVSGPSRVLMVFAPSGDHVLTATDLATSDAALKPSF
jgi:hypothetical protein